MANGSAWRPAERVDAALDVLTSYYSTTQQLAPQQLCLSQHVCVYESRGVTGEMHESDTRVCVYERHGVARGDGVTCMQT